MTTTMDMDQQSVEDKLNVIVTDLTALAAAIAGVNAKLDADGGVTGTNYAALWDVTLTAASGT